MRRERVRFAFCIDHSEDDAWVTAMGSGGVAAEIVRAARRYGIPIIQNNEKVGEIRSSLSTVRDLPPRKLGHRAHSKAAR